jgi:serine/threonine protein kinase
MIDRTLKHYRIICALGAGGMGEVYLAEDTTLDRKVALKILPADVASNRDRMERFVREAKAAAALNHPNIAHIYEIGDSEGTPFIAMEYVDGVTLREKIHPSREPLAVLLGYLSQVAEGLAKAHHADIVHRDLKPDNVMITRDGYAKILDFGLAKLVESPGLFGIDQKGSERTIETVSRSIPGMVLGTIGYMSPEQASGRVHGRHRPWLNSVWLSESLPEPSLARRRPRGLRTRDAAVGASRLPDGISRALPRGGLRAHRTTRRLLALAPNRRRSGLHQLLVPCDSRPVPGEHALRSAMYGVDAGSENPVGDVVAHPARAVARLRASVLHHAARSITASTAGCTPRQLARRPGVLFLTCEVSTVG